MLLNKILKRILPNDRKQMLVFGFCFGLSALAWTLITFSRTYEEVIALEVDYINPPADHVLVSETLKDYPLKVKASGFDLFNQSVGLEKKKLTIDLSQLKKIKKRGIVKYIWLSSENLAVLQSKLGEEIKVGNLSVDSVNFDFSPIIEKEVVVKANIEFNNEDGMFSVKKPIVSPHKIILKGAASVLRKIDTINTKNLLIENLETSIDEDVVIPLPKGVVSSNKDSVRVFMEVQALQDFNIDVKPEILNVPDSIEVKLFPEAVEVSFTCGAIEFSNIDKNSFKAEIDFDKQIDGADKLQVNLKQLPSFVSNVRISPAKVEYIARSK